MERNVSDQDRICPSYVMGVISHGRLVGRVYKCMHTQMSRYRSESHRCFLRALAASIADLEDSSTKSVWIPVEVSSVGRSVDGLKDSSSRSGSLTKIDAESRPLALNFSPQSTRDTPPHKTPPFRPFNSPDFRRLNSKSLVGKLETLPPKNSKSPSIRTCPSLVTPVSSTAQPRRCSPPPPAPSCTVAAAPRDGNRRSRPPSSSPPPNFIFSVHTPSHGLGPSFGLCRSNPADSAQPTLPSPAETIRPVPPRLGFGPERATHSAQLQHPAQLARAPGPTRPAAAQLPRVRLNPRARPRPPHARSNSPAQRPLCSRSALFRPPGPV
ncbi:hypothetical protein CRG98_014618 [Punica granatum]|uniref:Uncharacterized protein n=1 Tax=Punica granatum TaxID=22663 RepID=A0A2I0K8Y7_PUNGR|nr:hypothetical protein CRG98_014618 [Punica granatum]